MNDATRLSLISTGKNIAAFLVAIGVAGEFLGDWMAGPINTRLENARQLEVKQLQRDTAAANLARVKLEEQLAWRTLTSAQVDELCTAMKPFLGQVYGVFLHLDNPEENALSGDIVSALGCARWELKGNSGSLSPVGYPDPLRAGLTFRGLAIDVSPEAPVHVKRAATALASKLTSWGIVISPEGPFGVGKDSVQGELPKDQIRIVIGRKP